MYSDYEYKAVMRLFSWIEKNGGLGYDPYDIKEKKAFLFIQKESSNNWLFKVINGVIHELQLLFPKLLRIIFSVNKRVYPQALALNAMFYMNLYELEGDSKYLNKANDCFNDVLNLGNWDNDSVSWGCPFSWQSKVLIPKNTSNGVSTAVVGEAYWKRYQMFSNQEDLDICVAIAEFFVRLPRTEEGDKLCFSYTNLYINHVHNLNLFIADFLIDIGKEINEESYVELGKKALNYTLSDQNLDGSFDYFGPPKIGSNKIDHYHTTFVLKKLLSIYDNLKREDIMDSFNRGTIYYKSHFFKNGHIPIFEDKKDAKIDIHSCAEAINFHVILSRFSSDNLDKAKEIAKWTIENLQDKKGYFYYGKFKSKLIGSWITPKIPFVRWSNGWMGYALSNLILHTIREKT